MLVSRRIRGRFILLRCNLAGLAFLSRLCVSGTTHSPSVAFRHLPPNLEKDVVYHCFKFGIVVTVKHFLVIERFLAPCFIELLMFYC